MDREKVIKGLHAHANGCGYRSDYCDAIECPYRYGDESCDIEEMCRDALELLKEQEAVKVRYTTAMGGLRYGACPRCDARIDNLVNPKACGFCGRPVKWE